VGVVLFVVSSLLRHRTSSIEEGCWVSGVSKNGILGRKGVRRFLAPIVPGTEWAAMHCVRGRTGPCGEFLNIEIVDYGGSVVI